MMFLGLSDVKEQRAEVKMTLLTEFNEENSIRCWLRDGINQGKQEKAVEDARKLLADGKYTAEEISKLLQIPTEAFA